jgi:inorganic pyrophosphatase
MDAAAFTGCVVRCRLIGAIEAEQTEDGVTVRNDRLIAVAAKSLTHRSLQDIDDVSADLLAQIEHFFVSYNMAKGKTFTPVGRASRAAARRLVDVGAAAAK